MNFNIQGLSIDKMGSLEIILEDSNVDICCLSEHWQNTCINSLNLSDFEVVTSFTRENFKRGGVCILIKRTMDFSIVQTVHFCEEKVFEVCCIKCNFSSFQVYVCSIYRSPNTSFGVFLEKISIFMEKIYSPQHRYVLCGDLNVDLLPGCRDRNGGPLKNLLLEFNIKQTVFIPTRITNNSETCIDNIFTDIDGCVSAVFDNEISDHTYQILDLKLIKNNVQDTAMELKRKYSAGKINLFKQELSRVNWFDGSDSLNNINNINEQLKNFLDKFFTIFNYAFPTQYYKNRPQNKKTSWISRETRELSKMVREMAAINKRINNTSYKIKYLALRKYYRDKIKKEKRSFNDRRISNSKNINKTTWTIINQSRGKKNNHKIINIVDPFSQNGRIISDKKELSETFNTYFIKGIGHTEPKREGFNFGHQVSRSFFLFPTTPQEICKVIRTICNKRSHGVDDVPGTIIVETADVLASPLSVLINNGFLQGVYPKVFKESRVIPIYKGKGDSNSMNNYRPVAIQCHFAKIFEYCFNQRLSGYLEKFNLLTEHQNGFRGDHSTQTALGTALDHIYQALNDKQHVMGIFFDMSKAFDTVDHDLLLRKLDWVGVRGPALSWVRSYLVDRSQRVEMDGVRSDSQNIKTGTPQGSCLSPTLFNVFINDLPLSLSSKGYPVLYADDSNVIVKGSGIAEIAEKSNAAAQAMTTWCDLNGLNLNTKKSLAVEFAPKNKTINYSVLIKTEDRSIENFDSTKFLGVHLDQKLTWSIHISSLLSKLSSYSFLIRSIRDTVSMDTLRLLYFGLVQSTISYGIIYWGNAHDSSAVFIAQKKIIRNMVKASPLCSCKEYFHSLNLMTLVSLYIYSVVIYITKHEHTLPRRGDIHGHDTRHRNEYHLPFSRLTVGQQHPSYIGRKILNKLRRITHEFNAAHFNTRLKIKLKKFLTDKCYYTLNDFFGDSELSIS